MLLELAIRNFAVIEDARLEFSGALTALTGESGAGKSMVVEALLLALGERADADAVRAGANRAEVSASFGLEDCPDAAAWLAAAELDADGACVLRRSVGGDGRSRCYINDRPVPAARLRELAQHLIEIHGQHAYQALLRTDHQLALLDRYGDLQPLARAVRDTHSAWRNAREALDAAQADAGALDAQRATLQERMAALDALDLQPGEWQALEAEQARLAHLDTLAAGAAEALALLDDAETPTAAALGARVAQLLGRLAPVDAALEPLAAQVDAAVDELRTVASALRRYASDLEPDPQRSGYVDERLREALTLSRRYGAEPAELPDLTVATRAELDALEDPAASSAALQARCAEALEQWRSQAAVLSAARQETAARLEAAVNAELARLGMQDARFVAALEALPQDAPDARGAERVELRLAPHPGAIALPLARVASGGELSRLSLAIEAAALARGGVPTVVLDEVDVGIGGRTAGVVGAMLQALGGVRQVLCVTHLPQVAAYADHHLRIERQAQAHPPRARVDALDARGRIAELARMLGGEGPTARAHARELLQAAERT